jgi:hypothetical protein
MKTYAQLDYTVLWIRLIKFHAVDRMNIKKNRGGISVSHHDLRDTSVEIVQEHNASHKTMKHRSIVKAHRKLQKCVMLEHITLSIDLIAILIAKIALQYYCQNNPRQAKII